MNETHPETVSLVGSHCDLEIEPEKMSLPCTCMMPLIKIIMILLFIYSQYLNLFVFAHVSVHQRDITGRDETDPCCSVP